MQPVHASRSTVSHADVRGVRYLRIVVQTRWLTPHDELAEVLQTSVQGVALPGDTVVVSEKVAVLLTGRGVPIASVRPGVLARLLATRVRPRPGSRGLSVPEKMQYVLERSGRTRLLLAAAASAVTRPLGVHGLFYRIAGPRPGRGSPAVRAPAPPPVAAPRGRGAVRSAGVRAWRGRGDRRHQRLRRYRPGNVGTVAASRCAARCPGRQSPRAAASAHPYRRRPCHRRRRSHPAVPRRLSLRMATSGALSSTSATT